MRHSLLLLCLVLCLLPAPAAAQGLELRFGLDYLTRKQSDITGLNRLSLVYQADNGYFIGQSLYSSALGSGGGFFAGGIELGYTGQLGPKLDWEVGQFVGGGGGASQVNGNGLMLRSHASLFAPIGDYRLGLGAAWISISGSDIATPALSLTLSHPLDLRLSPGQADRDTPVMAGSTLNAVKPIYTLYLPHHSRKRSGASLERMQLIGGELTIGATQQSETFIQAQGVIAGDAEGYADWLLGYRYYFSCTGLQTFAELGIGTGGGGDVDTDGGLVGMAGFGAGYRFASGFGLHADLDLRSSLAGSFVALAPSLKLVIPFPPELASHRTPTRVHWQLRSGLVLQHSNPGYWKMRPDAGPSPLLFETGLNIFIDEHLYLIGLAATAVEGDAGGYQLGLLGIGYQQTINDWLTLAIEPLLGAGGGAGVDTRGGLLLGYRLSADFWITNSAALSAGFGQMTTFKGGGMQPETIHLGLKIPFNSWH